MNALHWGQGSELAGEEIHGEHERGEIHLGQLWVEGSSASSLIRKLAPS